jgi:hypothetical protein
MKVGQGPNVGCSAKGKKNDSVMREALYSILIQFGAPMKLVCLNETYSKIRVGKHVFDSKMV